MSVGGVRAHNTRTLPRRHPRPMATSCPRKPAGASGADGGMSGGGAIVIVGDVTGTAISHQENARTRTVMLGIASA